MNFQYRHIFQVYYVYDLPIGAGKRWLGGSNALVNGVLGGWRVSGITTYRSGRVLTVTQRIPGNKVGWLASYPDIVSGAATDAGRQSSHDTVSGVQWISPDAFAPPQPWTYGNNQPRSLFGPGYSNWDLSVMKGWGMPYLGEAGRLEFKADFFNLANHYNLGDPDLTFPDVRDGGSPSSTFGKIYGGYGPPRFIQVGLKLLF